jgi:hypothetical protein
VKDSRKFSTWGVPLPHQLRSTSSVFERKDVQPQLRNIVSMHQSAMRSAPLGFPLPYAHAAFSGDRRKDIGDFQSQHDSVYLKPEFRDGLPTPPVEDMGTTYQPPQYNHYARRPEVYSNSNQGGVSQGSYAGANSGSAIQGRQYSVPHSSLNHLPPPLVSAMRNDVHVSSQPPYRVPSPVQPVSSKNYSTVPRSEEKSRSSTGGDVISKSLQIPSSINNSGGSLAEFAAQVRKTTRCSLVELY